MATTTPRLGITVPSPDGSDDIGDWPAIGYQGGIDIENLPFLPINSRQAASLPTAYRPGITQMTLTGDGASSGGWGTNYNALVVTITRDSGNNADQLIFIGGNPAPDIRARTGTPQGWSAWRAVASPGTPAATASGTRAISNVTAPTSVTIAFAAGRFSAAPAVVVTAHGRVIVAAVSGISSTGFTLLIDAADRGNTIPAGTYNVEWIAIQNY